MKSEIKELRWKNQPTILEQDFEEDFPKTKLLSPTNLIKKPSLKIPEPISKLLKLKPMEYKLREKHFEACFMKDYRLPESEEA